MTPPLAARAQYADDTELDFAEGLRRDGRAAMLRLTRAMGVSAGRLPDDELVGFIVKERRKRFAERAARELGRERDAAAGSDRVRQMDAIEQHGRTESLWQRLMRAESDKARAIVSEMSPAEATTALARLNAAPGDNPAARIALEARAQQACEPLWVEG